jgi:hypothetical protein
MRRIVFILTLLMLAASSAAAQDEPTPQPQQNFIIGWAGEALFPQAVRFQVTMGRPISEIALVSLTVEPEGGSATVISVNIEESTVVEEPYSELATVWTPPADALPALFSTITFRWRVVSTRDEVAEIESSFVFSDERAQWVRDDDPRSLITLTLPLLGEETEDSATSQLGRLRSSLEPVYDLLVAQSGQTPRFNFLVYPDELSPGCTRNVDDQSVAIGPFSKTEVPCSDGLAETIFQASGYELVRSATTSLARVRSAVIDAMVRGAYAPLWSSKNVPVWFEAGLATFYQPESKLEWGQPLQAASRSGSLFALNAMNNRPGSADDLERWQAQSYGMVLYIAAQIGVDGLFDLARGVSSSDSFEVAYQTAMGRSLSTVISGMERWLFSDGALSAFNFTPYQAATPTPTATRTPTATNTPTPSATPTLTPTPTVTGALSATPLPTRTLTNTPTLPPPSTTPRPAGSLNTPAPTTVPPFQFAPFSDTTSALMLFVLGLAVIAVLALATTRRKR